MSNSTHQELVALELIDQSDSPVGAARLESAWKSEGIDKGEATAGRFLRQLDQQGYTTLSGRTLGRVLSDLGLSRLQMLRRAESILRAEHDLQQALEVTNTGDLLDLLRVRKLVECETARRAALEASQVELDNLPKNAMGCCTENVEDSARESMEFHRGIAEASHSPLLIAVMNLLLDPSRDPLERALSEITRSSGLTARLEEEHLQIAELLAARESEKVVTVMAAHFDTLIAACDEFSRESPAADS